MVRIGITGHCDLGEETAELVINALRKTLSTVDRTGLVGVSCLAQGADQLFAQVILEYGGTIEAVLPAHDYRAHKVNPDNRETFETLISKATSIHTMPFDMSDSDAYLAASVHVLNNVDRMIAVWDGESPNKRGGTTNVVQETKQRGIPLTILWPSGARRSSATKSADVS